MKFCAAMPIVDALPRELRMGLEGCVAGICPRLIEPTGRESV